MDLDFEKPTLAFFAPGIPAPGGSKRFMGIGKKTGRAILIDAGGERNKNWRSIVALSATELNAAPLDGALRLTVHFFMPRPKAHYFTGKKRTGELKPDAPKWHTKAPDTTKLLRSTEDALKGIAWRDDSQVAEQHAMKIYGERPGALIEISVL